MWRAGTRSSPERSRRPPIPLRVDAAGLRALTAEQLAAAFQVGADNPLVGLDGRLDVLHRLGDVLAADPDVFGSDGRPGGLLETSPRAGPVTAETVPRCGPRSPLTHLAVEMPPTIQETLWHWVIAGYHPALDRCSPAPGRMPFTSSHQWLTLFIDRAAGTGAVSRSPGLDGLTGLPEYRNSGLLPGHRRADPATRISPIARGGWTTNS